MCLVRSSLSGFAQHVFLVLINRYSLPALVILNYNLIFNQVFCVFLELILLNFCSWLLVCSAFAIHTVVTIVVQSNEAMEQNMSFLWPMMCFGLLFYSGNFCSFLDHVLRYFVYSIGKLIKMEQISREVPVQVFIRSSHSTYSNYILQCSSDASSYVFLNFNVKNIIRLVKWNSVNKFVLLHTVCCAIDWCVEDSTIDVELVRNVRFFV